MRGDFSRLTFDPKKRYSDVWMQQGRVQLDSDWNEQQAINRHRMETECQDTLGRSGAPSENPGFKIKIDDNGNLLIGSGRYYVDGILCENDKDIKYQGQPDLRNAPDIKTLLAEADYGVVYLDVWHKDITALDDPQIKEKALGGADTTIRTKTIWQVKVLPVKLGPGIMRPEYDSELFYKNNVFMNARTQPPEVFNNPCIIRSSAGYRGLENQLYRIEIHKGGTLGSATFKWSRDNGSIEIPIDSISGNQVIIRNSGSGLLDYFKDGTLVEIVDDYSELNLTQQLQPNQPPQSQPRPLLKVKGDPDAIKNIIILESSPGSVEKDGHPRLRRWDSDKEITVEVPATNKGWIPLGSEGIEVAFSVGDSQNDLFSAGDYWLIPARVATGELEWPPYEVPNTNPQPQPPMSVILCSTHHYSKLAEIEIQPKTVVDCRRLFPPLTGPSAIHITDTNWKNDEDLKLSDLFRDGLKVYLDKKPDSQSVNSDTMIVSVEALMETQNKDGGRSIANLSWESWILEGLISVDAKTIIWTPRMSPVPDSIESIYTQLHEALAKRNLLVKQLILAKERDPLSPLRLRVTLKGNLIWSVDGNLYLDGQVFGKPGKRGSNPLTSGIDLVFPSGDRAKASNFESWCNLTEGRMPNFLRWAYDNGFQDERAIRKGCSQNYLRFWDKMAKDKDYAIWFTKDPIYDQLLDETSKPFYKWFKGGLINAAYNALERHIKNAKGDKVAYIFVPETGKDAQKITYTNLYIEVNKLANGLKRQDLLNVQKQEVVLICMPRVPQTIITMLACAKIGAIHTVVFSDTDIKKFPDELSRIILNAQPSVIVTTDGFFSGGKPYPLKSIVDDAIKAAIAANASLKSKIRKVVVFKRVGDSLGSNVPIDDSRDIWYHKLIAGQPDECASEKMDSEDILFIQYSLGTAGRPNGILHTHGEYCVAPQQTLHWVFDIDKDDISEIWWCTGDIGSMLGHSYVVYGPLSLGVTSILYEGSPSSPDSKRWFNIIRENKVTKFYTEYTPIRLLIKDEDKPKKEDISSLKILGATGDSSDRLKDDEYDWYWKNIGLGKLPIMDTWWADGSSTFIISPLPTMEFMFEPFLPLPLPGFNVDVYNDDGNPVGPGETGQLVITKPWPSILRGFYNNPERAKAYNTQYWSTGIYMSGRAARKDKDGNIRI